MEFYDEKIKALAIEIYELDAEVYKKLGSSLGSIWWREGYMYPQHHGGSALKAEQLENPKRACPDK